MTSKTKEVVVDNTEVLDDVAEKKYDDEKRIVLWKNDKATEDNAQPAIRGQVTINGTKWYISLWNYTDKNGKPFCQGKVRKADEMVNTTQESLF